jgi:hypothetical protein
MPNQCQINAKSMPNQRQIPINAGQNPQSHQSEIQNLKSKIAKTNPLGRERPNGLSELNRD